MQSTVARLWAREHGVAVVDADALARAAVAPGTAGFRRVVAAFGPRVVLADGSLDRAALRALAFADPALRRALNAATHGPIFALLARAWFRAVVLQGHARVVLDAPLLVESGLFRACRAVVVLDVPAAAQIARVCARDGGSPEDAQRVIQAQLAPDQRRRVATHVLDNGGPPESLAAAARAVAAAVL